MRMAKREPAATKMGNQELAPSDGKLPYHQPEYSYSRPYPLRFPLEATPRTSALSGARPGVHRPALSTEQMPNPIPSPRHPAIPLSFVRNNVATSNVCNWNFAVTPLSSMSEIFAGPRRRGVLFRFVAV